MVDKLDALANQLTIHAAVYEPDEHDRECLEAARYLSRAVDLTAKASALVLSVEHDNTGQMVAGRWVAGNGGLLSVDTIKAADALRAELEKFRK